MTTKIKHYQNDEITVVWQPQLCTHSKKCWHGLPDVFNPEQRPWVNLDGAKNVSIIDQVKACPSGALSLASKDADNDNQHSEIKVTVSKAGPLLVNGKMTITQTDGQVVQKQGMTAFCRCGASNNKPFCDGSHKDIEFDS